MKFSFKYIVVIIGLLLLVSTISAVDLQDGITTTNTTEVNLTDGYVSFTQTDLGLSVTTSTLIDGELFIPNTTSTAGEDLVWGTGERSYIFFDDPIVKMEYTYNGLQLKETITLKEDKELSFPITLNNNSKLIPWDHGTWKIVGKVVDLEGNESTPDTMNGIIIEKPYGVDANGFIVEMDFLYENDSLNLVYNKSASHFVTDNVTVNQIYSPITYPLVIDPTWTSAGGCWTATYGAYTVVMWNTTGTSSWKVPAGVTSVDYLVVAGGGGGGGPRPSGGGGGGGAGGMLDGSSMPVNGTLGVSVGAGGSGGAYSGYHGSNGSNSAFSYITATGGGGGAETSPVTYGFPGGSGGGGSGGYNQGAGGAPVTNQGNYGGWGYYNYWGGGGGGAGTKGQNSSYTGPIVGGNGRNSSITGDNVTYAGGGGGGIDYSANQGGAGGSGGGGQGHGYTTSALNGTNGLGGGGGGGAGANYNNASGGSGVVIVRYLTPPTIAQYNKTDGAYTVVIFNGTGGEVTWTPPVGVTNFTYLVVGGGGGGGADMGGGGGAGGIAAGTTTVLGTNRNATGIRIIIGAGGIGSPGVYSATPVAGSKGGNSTMWSYDFIVDVGGGGGGGSGHRTDAPYVGGNATSGGSGGGAAARYIYAGGSQGLGAAGYSGQGTAGGNSPVANGAIYAAGGGGGSGENARVNADVSVPRCGFGGNGTLSSITGTAYYYAGGGGGGGYTGNTIGSGGLGGGGGGGAYGTATAGLGGTGGTVNGGNGVSVDSPAAVGGVGGMSTGGGGGGAGHIANGGDGGSGTIIIRYPTPVATVTTTTTTIGAYTIVKFNGTANGGGGVTSWTPPYGVTTVDLLVVGGGGSGGGSPLSGGGGAGGLIFKPSYNVSAGQPIQVVVGSGGNATWGSIGNGPAADPWYQNDITRTGANGTYSGFETLVAIGGGGGGRYVNLIGRSGGSGGGEGWQTAGAGTALQSSSLSGGYGNAGGLARNGGPPNYGGGGGGGAGAAGSDGTSLVGGNGGIGLKNVTVSGTDYNFSAIYGSTNGQLVSGQTYFAGGGGGSNIGWNYTSGGLGGGGIGGYVDGQRALDDTGGGGGGSERAESGTGGAGGSGVVLLRYLTPTSIAQYNSTDGIYTIIKFNGSGGSTTWTTPVGVTNISLLTVAGGGGGGVFGGGGGAGGLIYNTSYSVGGTMTVTIGRGGNGSIGTDYTTGIPGSSGFNSTFGNATVNITTVGGGGGGTRKADLTAGNGTNGGSGGGTSMGNAGALGTPGSGITGQGYRGGYGYIGAPPHLHAGGGGAGAVGENGTYTGTMSTSHSGAGGVGLQYNITGVNTYYAGGGGGATYVDGGYLGLGGLGGGGIGSNVSGASGVSGTPSTGGGGGGGAVAATGGAGGSGTIIIRYLNIPTASFRSNITVGSPSLAVQFNDTSGGSAPTSWQWNATNVTGNNTPFTFSTSQNPVYTFGIGNFKIILNVTNSIGSSTSTQAAYINVSNPVTSNFNSNVTFGGRSLAVSFTSLSTNITGGQAWLFGDEVWSPALWTQVNASSGWSARYAPTAVALPDGSIVLMGGQSYIGSQNDVWRSINNGSTWILMTEHSDWAGRYGPTSVVLSDGSIVMMGGLGDGVAFNDTWRSTDKGATWKLQNASSGWVARVWHNSVVLPDDTIVLTGGYRGISPYYNDTWRSIDKGITWTLANASSGWSARIAQTSVGMPDGSIILIGGAGETDGVKNDSWRSIDKGSTWVLMNASTGITYPHVGSGVAMFDNSMIFLSGYIALPVAKNGNETWRTADGGATWTRLNASSGWSERRHSPTVAMPDGSVIIMAGYDMTGVLRNDTWKFQPIGSNAINPSHVYTSIGKYNVSLQVFNFTNERISSIRRSGAVTVYNQVTDSFTANVTSGSVPVSVLFTSTVTNTSNYTWYFGDENYTQAWSQVNASSGWAARYGLGSASMPDGSIIIAGGYDGVTLFNDTWRSINNGSTWTRMNSSGGWSPRQAPNIVAGLSGSVILIGGTDGGSVFNDTWKSVDNGATWTKINSSSGWEARWLCSLVRLPDGSIIVMGGSTDPGATLYKNDTWRSTDEGITWTLMNTSSGWAARNRHFGFAMPDGSLIITTGYSGSYLNDTWRSINNGTTWTLMNASSAFLSRRYSTGVSNPDGSILLFSGIDSDSATSLNDVWRSTNNGIIWTRVNISAGWDARRAATSVIIPNGSVIFLGGLNQSNVNKNDTWIFTPTGSNAINPTHIYSLPGNHSVSLQAYSQSNSNITIRTGYINITGIPFPNFTANITSGYPLLSVMFNDTSMYTPTLWQWNFTNITGNNTPVTFATTQNVTWTFDVGRYLIKLTSSNIYGNNTSTQLLYINVSNPFNYTNGSYTVVKFNMTGNTTWQVPAGVTAVDYLVVAGGGSGGEVMAGGGGGGGMLDGFNYSVTAGTNYTIRVGDGARILDTPAPVRRGTQGQNSTFATIESAGGGGGSSHAYGNATNGGSGGGGGSNDGGGYNTGGSGIPGQGYAGGTSGAFWYKGGAGGGGAGEAGYDAVGTYNAGNGGDGRSSSITGEPVIYGGGGGGGSYRTGTNSTGGDGGGAPGLVGSNGTNELGGGGGGSYLCNDGCPVYLFGQGGSGIVILRYFNAPVASFTASNISGSFPVIVQFNDTSTNTPSTWQWNATNVTGNNTPFTFNITQHPVHIFGVGNFSIKLNVTNTGGMNTSIQNTWINISPAIPIANFTSNITIYSVYPMVVQFNDTSTDGIPTEWNWSFGDGRWFNTTNSSLRNATYTYAVANKYNVTLLVNNTAGSNITTKNEYINLTSDNDANLTSWLHMNGTNGSTTFSGEKGVAWSTGGNAYISTNQPKYGGASGRFSGTNAYIFTPNSTAFQFGTGDFTIEFWVNVTSVTGTNVHMISKTNNPRNQGWGLDRTNVTEGDSGWDFWMGNDSGGQVFFNASIPNKTWTHIAVERRSGTIYLYINGNLTNSQAGFNANYDTSNPVWIARQQANYFNGYIDEFRISKIARWKANFTPPYNEYRGTLETLYPDVNPDSTFRYKTNPGGSAYVDNVTGTRNRTVQIQNITNTSYVVGAAYFQPLYVYVKSVQLNTSYYASGMTLISSSIDNVNGIVEFNISKPTGFSPGTDRASIVDYTAAYVNYTDGSDPVEEYFAYGYLINGSTSKVYPIHHFLGTPVTYGDWNFTANFTANKTVLLIGEPVEFVSTFNGSYPNRWNWTVEGPEGDPDDYIDGANSTITYSYDTVGWKNVSLKEYLWQNGSVSNTTFKMHYILVYNPTTANISSNVTSGLSPLTVQLSGINSTNATWYNWSFGDGQFDNYTNFIINHTYNIGGIYQVNLTTSYEGHGANTQTGYFITVYNQTISGFTANTTVGLTPQGIIFNVTHPHDNATSWNWSFGDGAWQNGTTQNATHTYLTGGIYSVSENASNLYATNTTLMSNYITIYNHTLSGFTANTTFGIFPLGVEFNVTYPDDNATYWNWSFGDGNWQNGTTQNATYLYSTDGVYTVSEYASNLLNTSITTRTNYINVYSSVKANFTSNKTLVNYSPRVIQFTDDSFNTTGWSWFFGDEPYNQSWVEQNVSAEWSARFGQSSVTLPDGSIVLMGGQEASFMSNDTWRSTDKGVIWVQQNASSGWLPRYQFASVALPDGSIVLMGGSSDTGYKNDTWRSIDKGVTWVQQNASSGWSIRFGFSSVVLSDGSIVVMGGFNGGPNEVLNDVWRSTDKGVTWVQQTVSAEWGGRGGLSTVRLSDNSIVVMGGLNSDIGYYNDVWRSTNNGATWVQQTASAEWIPRYNFGSVVMPDNSIIVMGGYEYTYVGYIYDVWRSTDKGITWTELSITPIGRTEFSSIILPDGSIIIMGGSDGGIRNDVWRMQPVGSSLQNPEHTYTQKGNYSVVLEVYSANDFNSTPSYNYWINISWGIPIVNFTSDFTSGVMPLSVQFNDTSLNEPTSWNWSFGDGTYSNVQNASHIYASGGLYTVNFTATNSAGSNFTNKINYITVYDSVNASFTSNVTSGSVPTVVQFNDTSLNATGWSWFFGDEPYNESWVEQTASAVWIPRFASSSVVLPDGSIVLMGGQENTILADVWRSTDKGVTWGEQTVSADWLGRSQFSSVVLSDGSIVIMSGAYAPSADVWRSIDKGVIWVQQTSDIGWSEPRSGSSSVVLSDDSIILIGGVGSAYYDDVWKSTDKGVTWTQINATTGTPRTDQGSVVLSDNSIIFMGGNDGSTFKNDTWRSIDGGVTWVEQNVSSGWQSRSQFGSVAMPDGSIIIMGGSNDVGAYYNDTWRSIDKGVTWTNITGTPGWGARGLFSSVLLPDGSIVIMDGTDTVVMLNDVWRLQPIGSSLQNPEHTYTQIGNYSVVLEAYSANDFNSTPPYNYWINVSYAIPIVNFTSNVTSGLMPLHVQFNDTSESYPTSWNWSFGDGTFSDVQNASHIYWSGGYYTVNFTAENGGGSNVTNRTDYIKVYNQTTADFTTNASYIVVPPSKTVWYNSTSVNATIYNWSFHDGTWQNGTQNNSNFTYYTGGNYTINLTTSDSGYGLSTKYGFINVYNQTNASFTPNVTSGVNATAVLFTDSSSNATAWNWSFNKTDGNNTQVWFNTSQNPVHIFGTGTYSIVLNASNNWASNVSTQATIITVTEVPPPVASFTTNVSLGLFPLPVQFNDTSSGTPTFWDWSFGDGTVFNSSNTTSHVYTSSGNFTVILNVSNAGGFSNATHYINVYNQTVANISSNVTSVLAGNPVQFSAVNSTNATVWNWSFGDGTVVNNTLDPVHSYSSGGIYSVNLTTSDSGYGVSTQTGYLVTVYNATSSGFTGSPLKGVFPLDVTFTVNDTSDNATSWYWSFGDGGTNTTQNTAHIYSTGGTYTVIENASNPHSSSNATYLNYITVYNQTVANISSNVSSALSGSPVLFNGTSTNATWWNWSFGDGTYDNHTNIAPVHSYSSGGVYSVNLTTSDSGYGANTLTGHLITVYNTTASGFNANTHVGLLPLSVTFTVNDTNDNATAWNWSFGDGSYSGTQNPTHIYSTGGTYTVIENASNPHSSSNATYLNYITVYSPSIANISTNATSSLVGFPIQFDASGSINATSWNWSFGDGTVVNNTLTSVHAYSLSGNYTVNLTTSDHGYGANTQTNYYINVYDSVITGFDANITVGLLPLPVSFNVTTLHDGATVWNWSFGDGSAWSNSTIQQNASHIYTTGGNYTVTEMASNPNSSNVTIRTNYITIYSPTSNTFTSNVSWGYIPLPVLFTSTSTNATMWNWSFGDGFVDNGTNSSVSHIYSMANNYTVWLTTSDRGYGESTSSRNINATFYAPSTGFIATPMSGNAPLLVTFTDASLNAPTGWNWSFGDGSPFVYTQNTTHTYALTGSYTVFLTTTSSFGTSNFSRIISVFALGPVANFIENATIGASPMGVQFTDTSSYTNLTSVTWLWKFGDGTTSSLQNPSHTYSVNGVYRVNLTITDEIGTAISGDTMIYVTSSPVPMPDFIGVPTVGTTPLNVTFTDLTLGGKTGWNWTFGDGTYSNDQNPMHNYTTNGQYSVTLVVANGTYSNYTTKVGYINVGVGMNIVYADYIATPTSGNYPLTVQFTDTSVCNPICNSWNWDLDGDGATDSNAKNPVFTYNYPLTYSPKLIISNGINSGTKIRPGYIVVGPAFVQPTITQPTEPWVPGYQNNTSGSTGLSVSFRGDSSVDLSNSTYLKYWLQNFTSTGEFNVYGFVTSLMAPLMHVFGFWIFLIIWGLYLFAVWIRSQDVTLPLIIGIISMGTFGLLFPKEALPVIIIMFVICGAVIITKLMKDSI